MEVQGIAMEGAPDTPLYNITGTPEWNLLLNVLAQPDVSELQANNPNGFFIKRRGKRVQMDIQLNDEERYFHGVEKGLVPFVRSMNKWNRNSFVFEGRIFYKSGDTEVAGRCHIVLPPAADYPQITIAKKTASLKSLDAIASAGSMSTEMMNFLNMAIKANLTMVFSGGTGAGKDIYYTTKIPTTSGTKPAGEVKVGDIIFDEKGKKTKVIKKNSPAEQDFYEITFSNGEKVKAGGGHVWKVLDLNKKKEFGHKTLPVFTDEQLSYVLAAQEADDQFITINELMNLINGKPLSDKVAKKDVSQLIRNEIVGFGSKGGDLFNFKVAELLDKLAAKKQTAKTKEVTAQLEAWGHEDISLRAIRDLIDNRAFAISLLGELSSANEEVFYNKSEILAFLMKRHNERLEARFSLDQSKVHQARPTILIDTNTMFERGVKNDKNRTNFAVEKISSPVDYDEQDLPIDPYTLGAWLGDGFSAKGAICGIYDEVPNKIPANFGREYSVRAANLNDKTGQVTYTWTFPELKDELAVSNLIENKHVPDLYKIASVEQRLEFLAGLMDTDGTFDYRRGYPGIEMTNEQVVRSAREIASSLGWDVTSLTTKQGTYKNADGEKVVCKDVFVFYFYPTMIMDLRVPRKRAMLEEYLANAKTQQDRHDRHYIVDIQRIEGKSEEYFCFGVDSDDHTYLVGDTYIPTHNTTMLEALAKNISHGVRIGVAEDTPELVFEQPNVSYLKSVPKQPGMDEKDVATLSWVVAQFQRMRTDKVVIGETRGKEFADFLIAANSGMDGSMTTLHAENPTRCLTKMTSFVMKMGDGQPTRAINNDIANAVDLIVQLIITPEGKHRISHIEEIVPTLGNTEEAKITSQTLYAWDGVQDMFYKVGSMSDALRDKCILNGQDVDVFMKSEREKRYPIHNSVVKKPATEQKRPFGGRGIPTRQPQRPEGAPRRI